jgi:glycerophosphoryl diester phosphodiesterase
MGRIVRIGQSGARFRWRITTVLVVLAVLATVRVPADAQTPVTVYAHRGGAGLAPENTLGAFRHTQSLFGAAGVWLELDTQLTGDGQLVVIHDDRVDRTTDCTGAVIELTLAQLAPCNAAASFPAWPTFEPVPTLRDVFVEGRAAGWRLMVEIKDIPGEANFDARGTRVADALLALVAETGFPTERLIVQSFWPLALDRVERQGPGIRTALLTTSTLPGAPEGVGIPATGNIAYATVLRYEIAAPDVRTIDLLPATVDVAHTLGRQVVTWTPNTPEEIEHAIGLGVDGVISDRPDLVFAALGS